MNQKAFSRSERVAPLVREVICDCFARKIRDPRLRSIQITDVELSTDLKLARVYFHLDGSDTGLSDVEAALSKANGLFRREVGSRLRLRYVPTLQFMYDEQIDRARRIDEILWDLADDSES